MKLTGDLKKQVESAATKEEQREILTNAGISLTDDELEMVSGGFGKLVNDGCDDDELDDDVKIPKFPPRPSRL